MKYNLIANVTISIYTTVEAESLEEAIQISKERRIESYHWGDKSQSENVWVSDEFDGEPTNIIEN